MRAIPRVSCLVAGLAMLAAGARAEETVRTVRAELTGAEGSRFGIENLLGTMRVSEGSGSSVTVTATVHADSQALADAVRLERIPGGDGGVTLRVRYPYDKVGTFHYREPGSQDEWTFGFGSSSRYDYDGRSVRISQGRGTWLYADLEIQVPKGEVTARFRNLVGRMEAEGLKGRLHFEVSSADMRLSRLEGALELDGSSGDIRARDIRGTWKSDFTSGDCRLEGFEGESLEMNAHSGDFSVRSVKARKIVTQTNSGDARFFDADIEDLTAEATSGDIELVDVGARLKTIDVSTSSGDVRLRLPGNADFEASARQSSGDMRVAFTDGTSVTKGDHVVGYRRGAHGATIRVKTSSGDFSISPL
ncbi:MAG: DUF4097 family beta strand repeat-containing protein [Acidobacteriota bacterium]